VIVLPIEREPGDGEEGPTAAGEDAEKERPVSPNAPSDDGRGDANKHKKHLVSKHKCCLIAELLIACHNMKFVVSLYVACPAITHFLIMERFQYRNYYYYYYYQDADHKLILMAVFNKY
jgi:hypothetical protein